MLRLSAVDAIGPAFERVGMMLLRPFRLSTWLKLGFIGWLGGGLVTASGNFNFRMPAFPKFPKDQSPHDPFRDLNQAMHSIHLSNYLGVIILLAAVFVVISLIFLYFFCRFRFILFDSVVSGQAEIGRGWRRYGFQANRYFGFWFVYTLVNWAVLALVVGLPLWRAYKTGVFEGDHALLSFLELFASIGLGLLAAGIVFAIISTLVKDFILPLMALDDLPMGSAWSFLWQTIAAEPGAWAGYFGMKLLLAIATGIGLSIALLFAMLILFLVLLIPVALLIWLGVMVMKSVGVILGVIIFAIAALVVVAAFFCLFMILTAPVTVFFAAYPFYFFGGRYPRLGALLWPQPPAPTMQPGALSPTTAV